MSGRSMGGYVTCYLVIKIQLGYDDVFLVMWYSGSLYQTDVPLPVIPGLFTCHAGVNTLFKLVVIRLARQVYQVLFAVPLFYKQPFVQCFLSAGPEKQIKDMVLQSEA